MTMMKTSSLWMLESMVLKPVDQRSGHLPVGSAGKSPNRKTIVSGKRKAKRTMLKMLMRRWKAIVCTLSELQDWKRGTMAIAEVCEAQRSMAERSLRPINSLVLI
jgi:hypothetical protein